MVTKLERMKSQLNAAKEAYKLESEERRRLDEQVAELESERQKLITERDEIIDDARKDSAAYRKEFDNLQQRYNECHAELIEASRQLKEAKTRITVLERDLRDEQSVINRIRFACAHRIKVSHDCDVDSEWTFDANGLSKTVPVCEEVRFLREIVGLCKSNELPF